MLEQNHNHDVIKRMIQEGGLLTNLSVAYFSMEIGLEESIPTYAGGLGILAGDTLKSGADLGVNMVGVSLLHNKGYYKQIIDEAGQQHEQSESWDPHQKMTKRPEIFEMQIASETLTVQIWEYKIHGQNGHTNPVFFLDTNLEINSIENQALTYNLYPSNSTLQLKQEILLGIGGFLALQILGYSQFNVYHLNESHTAFLTLALQNYFKDEAKTKQHVCFTTHTPLPGGHQQFNHDEINICLSEQYRAHIPASAWQGEHLNLALLALHFSKFANGVAKKHQEVSQKMYPDYLIDSITNAIHTNTWVSEPIKQLLDAHLEHWASSPQDVRFASTIPLSEIKQAHEFSKSKLIDYINTKVPEISEQFKPELFTIGFARRAAVYKRADLIFRDIHRIESIAQKFGGLQFVFAGKAYPDDPAGKQIIKTITSLAQKHSPFIKIIYLENYNMGLSKMLVSGVDLWLNNPITPLEASGTSGMKASLNGVPNFSILDGWWIEGCIEGVTGWAIENSCEGELCTTQELDSLYSKLEQTILPLYYSQPDKWAELQRNCISILGSYFNTDRMVLEYISKAYLK